MRLLVEEAVRRPMNRKTNECECGSRVELCCKISSIFRLAVCCMLLFVVCMTNENGGCVWAGHTNCCCCCCCC